MAQLDGMAASSSRWTPAAALVSRLVELESVNPALDAAGSGERAIAEYVASWLRERGVDAALTESRPGRVNVVATLPGTHAAPRLLLTGHLDTVPLGGKGASAAPLRTGDRIYGRGAYDMKGGVAAMLLAAERLSALRLGGSVVVAAVADEEDRSVGTEALVEDLDADAAIVAEPTGLEIAVAHKGFAWFTVSTEGRAAHGSRPREGRDAIAAMGLVLVRLRALADRLAASPPHALLGAASVHASTISGGAGMSTYPAECELGFERRTIPGERAEQLEREVCELVDGTRAEWRLDLLREPLEVDPGEEIVSSLRRAVEAECGREARLAGHGGWTDAALIAAAGVPTVVFGPGGDGAHAEREWVSLTDVEHCADALARVAADFCGTR